MIGWAPNVEPPFQDDPQFWASVGRSADAFWTLVVATVLVATLGWVAGVAFAVPVVLVIVSGRHARASTSRTRAQFPTRSDWRDAERRAVAAALPGALIRYARAHR